MLPLWSFAAFQWVKVVIWILVQGSHMFVDQPLCSKLWLFLVSFWVLFVPFLRLWFKLKINVSMINRFQCDFQTSLTAAENLFCLFLSLFSLFMFCFFLSQLFLTAGRKWAIPIVPIVIHSGWMSPLYNLFKQISFNWNESRQEKCLWCNMCNRKTIDTRYSFYI